MNRGIVMQVAGRYCIVLTPDGSYRKINRAPDCRVGDEIEFDAPVRSVRRSPLLWAAAAAAVLFLAIGLPRLWTADVAHAEVVTYLSMDINPSLEIGVDGHENVLELKAYNADGAAVIDGLIFRGMAADAVTAAIMARVEERGFLDESGNVVITSIAVRDSAAGDFERQVAMHVDEAIKSALAGLGADEAVEVTVLSAPAELREASLAAGLSPGKLAVYLLAKDSGSTTPLSTYKEEPVQEAADLPGGLAAIAASGGEPDGGKAKLKALLEAEKQTQEPGKKAQGSDRETSGKAEDKAGNTGKKADAEPGGAAVPSPNGPGAADGNAAGKGGQAGKNDGKGQAGMEGGKGQAGKGGQAGKEGKSGRPAWEDAEAGKSGKGAQAPSGKDRGKDGVPARPADGKRSDNSGKQAGRDSGDKNSADKKSKDEAGASKGPAGGSAGTSARPPSGKDAQLQKGRAENKPGIEKGKTGPGEKEQRQREERERRESGDGGRDEGRRSRSGFNEIAATR